MLGAWCGYVGVTRKHPAFGRFYDDIHGVQVHGGITYSDYTHMGGHLCHERRLWWLGFDMGHANDYIPGLIESLRQVYFHSCDQCKEYGKGGWTNVRASILDRHIDPTCPLSHHFGEVYCDVLDAILETKHLADAIQRVTGDNICITGANRRLRTSYKRMYRLTKQLDRYRRFGSSNGKFTTKPNRTRPRC